MQAVEMREKQMNMRLSEDEAARLDRVATHYGLNAAGVIRFLLKREDDLIAGGARGALKQAPTLGSAELGVLRVIDRGERLAPGVRGRTEGDPTTIEAWLGEQYDRDDHPWLRRTLNELRSQGYVRKLKGLGYVLTPKGKEAALVADAKD